MRLQGQKARRDNDWRDGEWSDDERKATELKTARTTTELMLIRGV